MRVMKCSLYHEYIVATQIHSLVKSHGIGHLKLINYIVCKLYIKKTYVLENLPKLKKQFSNLMTVSIA